MPSEPVCGVEASIAERLLDLLCHLHPATDAANAFLEVRERVSGVNAGMLRIRESVSVLSELLNTDPGDAERQQFLLTEAEEALYKAATTPYVFAISESMQAVWQIRESYAAQMPFQSAAYSSGGAVSLKEVDSRIRQARELLRHLESEKRVQGDYRQWAATATGFLEVHDLVDSLRGNLEDSLALVRSERLERRFRLANWGAWGTAFIAAVGIVVLALTHLLK